MSPRPGRRLLPVLLVALLLVQAAGADHPAGADALPRPEDDGLATGITGFLENGGQVDPQVSLYAWTPGGGVALTDTGTILTLVDAEGGGGCNVRTTFSGAAPVTPTGMDPRPGVTNYLLGDDPAGWATGLRTFSGVVYRDLWPGVDLVYRAGDGQLKYELVVRPGARVEDVAFDLEGQEDVAIDERGDLVVTTVAGTFRDAGLLAYYADGDREEVACAFHLLDGDSYGFRLGDADPYRTLVIDPFVYSTFVGGGAGELEVPDAGVAVDDSGRALVAGEVNTTDFPVTVGAFQTSNAGGENDLFVLAMAADGSDTEWATYLGGTGSDLPYDIAVDSAGRPVVVGRTNSTDFPTTPGAFDTSHDGTDPEGFAVKLAADGRSLVFSTYLGGNDTDELTTVVLDDADGVLVAGNTMSDDLPASPDAAYPNHTGAAFDVFVARLSPDGSAVQRLTHLGGGKWDVVMAIDVDAAGNVYVGGETLSTDFPVTNGSYQVNLTNNLTKDGFIARLDPALDALGWSTYVGGSFNDYVEFLHADANGSVYAAGDTESGDFPFTNDSFQTVHQGAIDTFVLRMAPNGSALEYSTFLGGSDREYCEGFAVDDGGRATVVGSTISANFPTMTGVLQEARAGKFDTYLFRLDADGATPLYSTYLGGAEWDLANGLAMDGSGMAYLVGATDSTDYPVTPGAYQTAHGGRVDVFITKLDLFLDTERPVSVPGTDLVIDMHDTVYFDGSDSTDNVAVVNWTWHFTYNGTGHTFDGPTFSWTFHIAGKYYVYLTVADAVGLTDRQWVSVFVNDTQLPVAIAPDDVQGQQHWTITLDGGASHDNVEVVRWVWTFEYDSVQHTLEGEKVDFTFDEAGQYEITLLVEDAHGNWAVDHMRVTIIDITSPEVVLEFTELSVDQYALVRFNASGSADNVAISNYTWKFNYAGAPIEMYGPTPSFQFDRAGYYDVSVTVSDEMGNRAFGEVKLHVADTTHPVARAGSDVTIDQGGVVNLDASGSSDNVGIVDWTWTVDLEGEVSTFSGVQNSFTFNAAGLFTVSLEVSDAAGNTATDVFTVRVRDITPPVAVAPENRVIGQGDEETFDGSASTDNVGIVTYSWVLSLGTSRDTFDGPAFSYRFTIVGTYLVSLQVFDGSGLSDTDELTVVVLDTEPPVAEAGLDQEVDLDGTVRFDGSASFDNVNIASMVWTFNYNQAQEELVGESPSFTFQLQGTYAVTLTVTDDAGNAGTDTMTVTVLSDETVGGGGGSEGMGTLLWAAIALALVVLVVVVVVVARSRGGDVVEADDDMGWTPTEDEKRARDDNDAEGEGDVDAGDGAGDPGDR